MDSNQGTVDVHVRLIDGVLAFVPCKARQLDGHRFEIVTNDYLDVENDFSSIWQFFPGDIVMCEEEDGILIANHLVSSSINNRQALSVIYDIVARHGAAISDESVEFSKEGVDQLCRNRDKIIFTKHPIASKWIDEHCGQSK